MAAPQHAMTPLIAKEIESVLRRNRGRSYEDVANLVADALVGKYAISLRSTEPKPYDGKPRGGRIW